MISKTIQNVIEKLSKLPGIGPRQASRLAFHMMKMPKAEIKELLDNIASLKNKIKTCPVCLTSYEISDAKQKTCPTCANAKRMKTQICVVEKETDIDPIENANLFKGVYHVVGEDVDVLGKTTSSSVKQLLKRVSFIKKQLPDAKQKQMEVILAINATVEGDALSMYLEKQLKPLNITITRLGRGFASGSELEYADQQTLTNAFENRK